MTSVTETGRRRAAPALGTFERYLTLWVALCILAGIVLGRLLPGPFQALGRMTVAEVNIPVAVLIWLMIVPMLLKVDFGALHRVAEQWRGIAVTVGINWLVKPFSMALLGWLFIGWLFRPLLPAGQIDSYIAGLIILAAAPCTAMVFVWSNLTDGDPNFTLSQVALNDTIMVFAFAPIVALLLGLSSITVPWTTLFLSVVLYIVVPVIAAQLWRRSLLAQGGEAALARALRTLQPISLIALLATLVLLFGFQGEQIVEQPLIIALLAIPIVIQVYFNAGIAYGLNRALGVPHNVACPSALIGASNFFELAVAAAIALFGFQSGAALATVVGVLVEVPVMLSVVRIVLRYARLVRARADRLRIRPISVPVAARCRSNASEIELTRTCSLFRLGCDFADVVGTVRLAEFQVFTPAAHDRSAGHERRRVARSCGGRCGLPWRAPLRPSLRRRSCRSLQRRRDERDAGIPALCRRPPCRSGEIARPGFACGDPRGFWHDPSTALVGVGMWEIARLIGYPITFAWALVFGALISPTDPVAVLSTLKNVNVPASLEVEMQGESLFNDGIGIVLFTILLRFAMSGSGAGTSPSAIAELLCLKPAAGCCSAC